MEKEIMRVLCRLFSVSEKDIKGRSRKGEIVEARHVLFYILKMGFGYKLVRIGRVAKRDHTTAIHGIRKVENWMERDVFLRGRVQKLLQIARAIDEDKYEDYGSLLDRYRRIHANERQITMLDFKKIIMAEGRRSIKKQLSR